MKRTDINKDGLDVLGSQKELKSLLDGIGGSTTTNVKLRNLISCRRYPYFEGSICTHEVGGRTAVEVEDVHGSHGKTGTVNETANVTVKLDKVETVLGSLDFLSILLGGVSELEDVRLSEVGVIVETKLGVHTTAHLDANLFYTQDALTREPDRCSTQPRG